MTPEENVPVTIVPVAENGVEPIVAVMELVEVVDVVDEELELLVQLVQHTPISNAMVNNFFIKWF